jgi:flagellar biosynthesis protein FlhA
MVVSRVGKDKRRRRPDRQAGFSSPRSLGNHGRVWRCSASSRHARTWWFLLIAGALGYTAWMLHKRALLGQKKKTNAPPAARWGFFPSPNAEASWDDLQPVDTLGLEVGLPADRAGRQGAPGRPARPHQGVRKKFAQDVGFLPRRSTSATTSSSSRARIA